MTYCQQCLKKQQRINELEGEIVLLKAELRLWYFVAWKSGCRGAGKQDIRIVRVGGWLDDGYSRSGLRFLRNPAKGA